MSDLTLEQQTRVVNEALELAIEELGGNCGHLVVAVPQEGAHEIVCCGDERNTDSNAEHAVATALIGAAFMRIPVNDIGISAQRVIELLMQFLANIEMNEAQLRMVGEALFVSCIQYAPPEIEQVCRHAVIEEMERRVGESGVGVDVEALLEAVKAVSASIDGKDETQH
jgi:hypothetical protein